MNHIKDKKKTGIALKMLTYAAVIFVIFILQNTPYFLEFFGIKPNVLYVAAAAIAMYEGDFTGGLFGAFIGVLCDYGAYHTFGFNTILLLIGCTAVGLAVIYYMKNNLNNAFLFSGLLLSVRGFLEYYFVYEIWNYEDTAIIFTRHILPVIIYSLVFAAPVFWLVGKISEFYKKRYYPD